MDSEITIAVTSHVKILIDIDNIPTLWLFTNVIIDYDLNTSYK